RRFDGTSAASGGNCAREPAWPEDRPGHRRRIALGRCVQEVAVREMSATKGLEQRPFRPLSRTSRTDQRRRDCFIPTASDKLHLSDHGPATITLHVLGSLRTHTSGATPPFNSDT